ncbi:O-antigen ligase family protein [Enterococcus casseliflavus]|uniref:O-antigen ligase family protein n=1 Tax=Enterococcus casseliflavus TaxID=37734 RepID=UPI00295397EE|nr:O-antigen ligase family protein [Enterococcus casseliflavus]MDV7688400.1 O-antigen ligase family protein [Enterococcus casseliflavus]
MIKNIYKLLFFLLLISYIFTYTLDYAGTFGVLKYLFTFSMLTYFFFYNVNKSLLKLLSFLLLPFVFMPLLLITFGYTRLLIQDQLINSIYYVIFFGLILVTTDLFDDLSEFCRHIQFSVLVSLGFLAIQYRDLTINFFTLLDNILTNTRVIRAYLGFINPNILALAALIGGLSSFYLILNDPKKRKLNWTFFIFTLFIIVNSGSRTSLFCILLSIIFVFYYKYIIKISKSVRWMISLVIFILFLFGAISYFNQNNLSVLQSLDINTLTSGRWNNQISTFNYLRQLGYFYFGIGNLNSSSFYSEANNYALILNTDNSPTYYIATIGIVGLILILIFLGYLFIQLPKRSYFGKSLFLIWLSTSMFEHTLIVPSSLFSLFFMSFILIVIKNSQREGEENENRLDF